MSDDFIILVVLMLAFLSGVDWGTGWVWPVPNHGDIPAVITNPFRSGPHYGVDIMYMVGGKPSAPEGTPILAARDGTVWSTGQTARGWNVVLDHGPPFATFYQHLTTVFVTKGMKVSAGQQIGIMGADPTDPEGLRHLHFAVWYKGNGDKASVDPEGAMKSWRRVAWT
jgi:murein DD-endopeptidase MepM/ murein hydrolase activator NlpD